jgi:hypothetical protein
MTQLQPGHRFLVLLAVFVFGVVFGVAAEHDRCQAVREWGEGR